MAYGNGSSINFITPPVGTYYQINWTYAGHPFYMQQTFSNLNAGVYIVTFYSISGYYITFPNITVSMGNSTDTFVYTEIASSTWTLKTAKFIVKQSGQSYIKWTPSTPGDTGTQSNWGFIISSITYNGTVLFTDKNTNTNTYIGADISQMNNLYAYNLYINGNLSLTGTPNFSLGENNINCLNINSSFGSSSTASNQECLIIGNSVSTNAINYTNCTHIGNIIGGNTTSNRTLVLGQNISGATNNDVMIGNFLNKNGDTISENVMIGYNIGSTDGSNDGAGCGRFSIAIGSNIYNAYNGYGINPSQPLEAIAIGYSSQSVCFDNYNTSIGSYTLQNIIGNANNTGGGQPIGYLTQYNTALGHSAGKTQSILNNCTFIGAMTDASNNISNATALGYGAYVGANYATAIGSGVSNSIANSVCIGRSSDLVQIDGSLNVISGIIASTIQNIDFGTNSPIMNGANINGITDSALSSNIPLLNRNLQHFTQFNYFDAGINVSSGNLVVGTGDSGSVFQNSVGIYGELNLNSGATLTSSGMITANNGITVNNADLTVGGGNGGHLVLNTVAPVSGGGTGLVFAAGWNNGQVYYQGSTRDIKTNITEISDNDEIYNLETFMKLKPSLYFPKEGYGNTKHRCVGFIAEEINEIGLKELNSFKNQEMTELAGVHYDRFSAYLVKVVQLQQKIINNLSNELKDCRIDLTEMKQILQSKNII